MIALFGVQIEKDCDLVLSCDSEEFNVFSCHLSVAQPSHNKSSQSQTRSEAKKKELFFSAECFEVDVSDVCLSCGPSPPTTLFHLTISGELSSDLTWLCLQY